MHAPRMLYGGDLFRTRCRLPSAEGGGAWRGVAHWITARVAMHEHLTHAVQPSTFNLELRRWSETVGGLSVILGSGRESERLSPG